MCVKKLFLLLSFVSFNGYAYEIEHYARVINASRKSITVDYDVCKYTNSAFTQCEPHQDTIAENSSSANYFEVLVDWIKNSSSGKSIYTFIVIKQVTNGSITTRFRTNESQKNDNPEIPLQGYCRTYSSALVIQEIEQYFQCRKF